MGKYNIYQGSFVCHTCKAEVKSLRMYASEKLMTWMCSEKHLSQVSLKTKKDKKDFNES